MEPRVVVDRSSRVWISATGRAACVDSSVDEPCINILPNPYILSPAIANTKLDFYREILISIGRF